MKHLKTNPEFVINNKELEALINSDPRQTCQ